MKDKRFIVKQKYERVWEGSDLFGYDFLDFRIFLGRKHLHWKLFINRNVVSNSEAVKGTSMGIKNTYIKILENGAKEQE
jgi:hypothetical protein